MNNQLIHATNYELAIKQRDDARAERDALRAAAQAVLSFRDGKLPNRGWMRDNDASRQALHALDIAAAPTPPAAPRAPMTDADIWRIDKEIFQAMRDGNERRGYCVSFARAIERHLSADTAAKKEGE